MTARARIIIGEVLDGLAALPDASVRCCVTSPPYWGLRDYGHRGQIGHESSPEEWAERLVDVFREVRRVLARDGSLWLNLGDSYAGSRAGAGDLSTTNKLNTRSRGVTVSRRRDNAEVPRSDVALDGYKPKDLIGQPWLLAFALRADGWWLRSDIIWEKPNPMPESVRDRPTSAHEHLFLLTKSERYHYSTAKMREPLQPSSERRLAQNLDGQAGSTRANGGTREDRPMKAVGGQRDNGVGFGYAEGGSAKPRTTRDRTPSGWDQRGKDESDHHQLEGRYSSGNKERKYRGDHGGVEGSPAHQGIGVPWTDTGKGRNLRNVWTIPTQPYAGAHFATFPEELAKRCIVGGSERGDTVLDPFGGSGTTARVAIANGRSAIHLELVPEYTDLATHRIGPLLCDVEVLP